MKNMALRSRKNRIVAIRTGLLAIIFPFMMVVMARAQNANPSVVNVEVIQTQIGGEEILENKPAPEKEKRLEPQDEEFKSIVTEVEPEIKEPAPAAKEPTPAIKKPNPVVKEPPLPIKKPVPEGKKPEPAIKKPAPEVKETEPVIKAAAPAIKEVSPAPNEKVTVSKMLAAPDANTPSASSQILKINKSLKDAISENKSMQDSLKSLEGQIKMLRGQREIDYNRVNVLTQQRDQLIQRTSEIEELNKKTLAELQELKSSMTAKETELNKKLLEAVELSTFEPKLITEGVTATEADKVVAKFREINYQQILSKAHKVNRDNERLKTDSAKVHYNIGNIFFHRGDYEKAAEEYRDSVELMPYDAKAHYNLAFVSGEFLNDQQTALAHYQYYLYLNPDADDMVLVKEKILAARLSLRSQIDSGLDRDKKENRKPLKKGDDTP